MRFEVTRGQLSTTLDFDNGIGGAREEQRDARAGQLLRRPLSNSSSRR
jgi:hypothetical protein